MTDRDKEPGVILAQVYLDCVEFSHRADALLLPADTKAAVGNVDVSLEIAITEDEKAGYIRLTATTVPDSRPIYNVKLTMVGLAKVGPEPNMPIRDFLIGSGVSLMYPFVREALANITQRGRFGPVWLNPINAAKIAEQLRGEEPGRPVPSATRNSEPAAALPQRRRRRRPSAAEQAQALRRERKKK